MYAVIEDGSQQFRVSEGDVVEVALRELPKDSDRLEFDRVLLVSNEGQVSVGTPLVAGAKVVAEIVAAEFKGPKVYSLAYRAKKDSRKKTGHRQKYVQVRITQIVS